MFESEKRLKSEANNRIKDSYNNLSINSIE